MSGVKRLTEEERVLRRRKNTKNWRIKNKLKILKFYRKWRNSKRKDDLERARNWNASNKHHPIALTREKQLRSRFGITLTDYAKLLKRQKGRRAICRKLPAGKGHRFSIDHNHRTLVVRGILCPHCNRGLGHFRDSPRLLLAALTYLKTKHVTPFTYRHFTKRK